jgi:NAD(P)H dehydrogenase (quinone)
MIIVTGATGQLGSAIVDRLLTRMPPERVGVSVREDGPVSWTSHADLAEAAAVVLAEGGFDGRTPALTASRAFDLAEIAGIATELTGRTIARTVISDAEYRAGLVAHGVPAAAAEMLGGMFVASRRGEFAAVDPTMARLIGRPPQTARDILTDALA